MIGQAAADAQPYHQEFLDRGGDRLGLQVYPRPAGDSAPAVVIWPAMGVPARYYRPLAQALAGAGLAVTVADLRGTGASTPRASRRSRYSYRELAADVGAVLEAQASRLHGRRVLLLGHSLGGQACALHLAIAAHRQLAGHEPTAAVDGLVLVAVGLPWYRSYPSRRSHQVLGFTHGILAVSTVLRVWPGWGFGGRQAAGVIRDWGYTARHGRFPVLDGIDVEAALRLITTPVLAISVEHDRYTPAATLDHLCAKMARAPVERVHVSSAQAGASLDHFLWVRSPEPIVGRVTAFADALGERPASPATPA